MNIANRVAGKSVHCYFLPAVVTKNSIHVSPHFCKNKAGKHKISKFNNKPLTYDQAHKPDAIGWKKSHLSFHTGNLHGEPGAYQFMYEDQFLRKFLMGTFYRLLSGIVIKRRFNMVDVVVTVDALAPRDDTRLDFLIGYSERFLSAFLKCNVRIYTLKLSKDNCIYKYI